MRFHFIDVLKTIVICLFWALSILLVGIISLMIFGNHHHSDARLVLTGILLIPIFIVILYTIKKHLLGKNGIGWDAFGFVPLKKNQLLKLVWQVPLFWFIIIISQIISFSLFSPDEVKYAKSSSTAELLSFGGWKMIIVFIGMAVITPILEEIIFRGGIFKALYHKWNFPIAALGSAFLFMLVHVFIPFIMPAIFVMGLAFAYLYHKYKSIYAPIMLHMFINGINVIAVNFIL